MKLEELLTSGRAAQAAQHAKLSVLVQNGGAFIDTNSFDITINEPLLEDFGSPGGGLTKNGGGLLTLAVPSTLSGDVTVNAGGLSVKVDPLNSWAPASLTHSGDALGFDLGSANPSNPAVINPVVLTVSSNVTVNVTGSNYSVGEFPLIEYSSKTITGSLTLNTSSLPSGVVATLEDNGAGLIYIDVTAVPAPPPDFPVNDTFDAGTGKWYKAANSGSLTNNTGRLRWAENGNNMAEAIGRSFDAQTLTVGQTMRLTFDFAWSSATTTGSMQIIRAGLFNVTTPITADDWSGSNAIGPWSGYFSFVRDGDATGNKARRDAASTTTVNAGPTNNAGVEIGSNDTNFNINDNATVTYQGTFEVTYVSPTQVDTLFTLKEGEITRFSVPGTTSTIYNTFNTVVLKTGANTPIASLFLGTALSNATTVFTDTFDFGTGTGSWYKASTSGTLSNTGTELTPNGKLSWAENGSNMAEAIGRSFTLQTLAVGETIRLTFDFTWSSGIASGDAQIFRVGLFDVTTAIGGDNWSDSNAIGAGSGYYTFVRDGSGAGNIARRENWTTAGVSTGPTNGGGTVTPIGSNTTNYNMPNGTAYQGLFEVTYVSATQIDTLFTLNEGSTNRFSVSGTHDTNVENSPTLVTSFDTVVMKAGANTATITLDNIQLTVIPEPGAAALGAFGLLALLRRRRN